MVFSSKKSNTLFALLAVALCLFAVVAEGVRDYPKHAGHREEREVTTTTAHYATLVGTQWLDHAKKSYDIGMTFLPNWKSKLTAYGTNHTDLIQFTGLSDNDDEGHKMIIYADDQKAQGITSVAMVDVHTAELLVPVVPVPVISIAFVGISIKLNYDRVGSRTIVSGALPIHKGEKTLQHGFYEIKDGASQATSMGFKLEDVVPKGFFMNGQLEILGTKLSVLDDSTGVQWQGLCRNNTNAKNSIEFVLAGIDVNAKKFTKAHTFPMGDCRFLGSMVWDKYTKSAFLITLNMDETKFILAQLDPAAGTCKKLQDLTAPPLYGLMDFDPADSSHETLTFLQDPKRNMLSETQVKDLSQVEVLNEYGPVPIVTSPLLTGSSSRMHHEQFKAQLTPSGENEKKMTTLSKELGPVPAQPSSVVNYNTRTGLHTEMSPVTCDPVKVHDCPWQLGWYH